MLMDPKELNRIMYTGSDEEILSVIRAYEVQGRQDSFRESSIERRYTCFVTPLYQAVAARRVNVIESLLLQNYDANLTDSIKNSSYLLHAIFKIPCIYNLMDTLNITNTPVEVTLMKYIETAEEMKLRKSVNIEILYHVLHYNTVLSEDKLIELDKESNEKELRIAKLLLDNGIKINAIDKHYYTALHFAAERGMIDMIRLLLDYGADTTLITRSGNTALELAILFGNLEAVSILLDHYDDKEVRVTSSSSNKRIISNNPLIKAIRTCNLDIVSFLINSGLDVNIKDKQWRTPLHHAADMNKTNMGFMFMEIECNNEQYLPCFFNSHTLSRYNVTDMIKIVELLLLHGADVNARDKYKKTPLHYASKIPYTVEIVELLIANGADIHAQDRYKKTALINSTDMPTYEDILHSVCGYNSSIEDIDSDTYTVLCTIAKDIYEMGSKVSKLLIEHEAEINAQDMYGKTPLYNATKVSSMIEIVKILIEKGANINVTYKDGKTPLHNASVLSDGAEIVEILIALGAYVNAKDETGNTPLHYAFATHGCAEIVKLLLYHGADMNSMNQLGKSPLHEADSLLDELEITSVFMEKDYNIDAVDIHEMTSLHRAITKGYKVTKQLIDLGANVIARDKYGRTSLHIATSSDIAKILIENGCSVNDTDVAGKTPLHYASESDTKYDLVKTLISSGARVNVRDRDGNTPLHSACHASKIVKLLLEHGAEINITNNYDITPLDAAIVESIDSAKIMVANILLEVFRSPELISNPVFIKNMKTIDGNKELSEIKVTCEKELEKTKYARINNKYSLDVIFRSNNIKKLITDAKIPTRKIKKHLRSFDVYATILEKAICVSINN
ncbi:CNPV223 ankyrin repeat protein [Canarypox virus]|uniref:CNPV223 ankyrin repeat protein n=1 Tax=Canarypox virus TaxID=44088 RepID=Q6VZC4_CNPV|nr:CNPV223 ankyrin repeat protein [Canarypox virus]AAR83569.1 CNPV223 ankyrin repeat protein [Canarypox virus]AWD84699.1 ankyrin repeat protein [Canarypox virus]